MAVSLYTLQHNTVAFVLQMYPDSMSKRPTDHLEPAAKKRGNERQLTKDDPSDDEEVIPNCHACCAAWQVRNAQR